MEISHDNFGTVHDCFLLSDVEINLKNEKLVAQFTASGMTQNYIQSIDRKI